jgi:hypothetical protein
MGLLFIAIVIVAIIWFLGFDLAKKVLFSIRDHVRSLLAEKVQHQPYRGGQEATALAQWMARGGPQMKLGTLCDQGQCKGRSHADDPDCICNMRFHELVNGRWYRIDANEQGGYKAVLVK